MGATAPSDELPLHINILLSTGAQPQCLELTPLPTSLTDDRVCFFLHAVQMLMQMPETPASPASPLATVAVALAVAFVSALSTRRARVSVTLDVTRHM